MSGINAHDKAYISLFIGSRKTTNITKHLTALLQLIVTPGEPTADIHPPTNIIPTALQQNPYRSTLLLPAHSTLSSFRSY